MSSAQDSLPLTWVFQRRICHGRLFLEEDALHLVCLSDSSLAASAALNAAGAQLGLIGGVISAVATTLKERSAEKKAEEVEASQEHLTPAQRVTQNPLSRTVPRIDIKGLATGNWRQMPALETSGGSITLRHFPATTAQALTAWCEQHQIPLQKTFQKPMAPWLKRALLLTPVALAAAYFLLALPYAARLAGVTRAELEGRARILSLGESGVEAITGPFGKPLEACAPILKSRPEQWATYVGQVPDVARAAQEKSYEAFPRYAFVQLATWSRDELKVAGVEDPWLPTGSLSEAYKRIIQSPGEWSRRSHSSYGLPQMSQTRLLFTAKVTAITVPPKRDYRWDPGMATLAVRVLDFKTGESLCEGDVRFSFKVDSTEPGFIMSQALPRGVLLPLCGDQDTAVCRDVAEYAQPAPAITLAASKPAPVHGGAPTPAKRRAHR